MTSTIPGLRKAAILLRSLDGDTAQSYLAQMPRELAEAVTAEVGRLSNVDADEQGRILAELRGAARVDMATPSVGVDATTGARMVERTAAGLTRTMPAGEAMGVSLRRDEGYALRGLGLAQEARGTVVPRSPEGEARTLVRNAVPLAYLSQVPIAALGRALAQERPRVQAIVLARLPTDRAGLVLETLPAHQQGEVVRRMTAPESVPQELLWEVEERLHARLRADEQDPGSVDGMAKAAEVLSVTDRNTAGRILATLHGEDPALATRLRERRLQMDDLTAVDDATLRAAAVHMDIAQLACALHGASRELRERSLRLLPRPLRTELQREWRALGPVRLSDIEAAQQALLALVDEAMSPGAVL